MKAACVVVGLLLALACASTKTPAPRTAASNSAMFGTPKLPRPIVMASADHLIEVGPDGGDRGGKIIAVGTPRAVSKKKTATGEVLRSLLRS